MLGEVIIFPSSFLMNSSLEENGVFGIGWSKCKNIFISHSPMQFFGNNSYCHTFPLADAWHCISLSSFFSLVILVRWNNWSNNNSVLPFISLSDSGASMLCMKFELLPFLDMKPVNLPNLIMFLTGEKFVNFRKIPFIPCVSWNHHFHKPNILWNALLN